MKDKQQIIIKKVKKVSGGGHHGGSWKVAYADFVTAMMAFFLLLWLVTMVSPEKRARVSAYFRYFSLFKEGGGTMPGQGSTVFSQPGESPERTFNANMYQDSLSPQSFQEAVRSAVETLLGDIKTQILIRVVKEGVKIDIVDREGRSMFKSGSAELTPRARKALRVIGENIAEIGNKLYIEGHTDSVNYSERRNYSNWELSTERANAARRFLEDVGITPDRIIRVIGYADRDPVDSKHPEAAINRRISIVVLFPERPPPEEKG